MAYNNGFPIGYQNQLYYPQYQAPAAQQANSSPLILVQGEAGAKSYLVAPNSSVVLFDSENQSIYIKSADASGMPSIRVLDYKIRDAEDMADQLRQMMADAPDESTRKDLERLVQKIEQM